MDSAIILLTKIAVNWHPVSNFKLRDQSIDVYMVETTVDDPATSTNIQKSDINYYLFSALLYKGCI